MQSAIQGPGASPELTQQEVVGGGSGLTLSQGDSAPTTSIPQASHSVVLREAWSMISGRLHNGVLLRQVMWWRIRVCAVEDLHSCGVQQNVHTCTQKGKLNRTEYNYTWNRDSHRVWHKLTSTCKEHHSVSGVHLQPPTSSPGVLESIWEEPSQCAAGYFRSGSWRVGWIICFWELTAYNTQMENKSMCCIYTLRLKYCFIWNVFSIYLTFVLSYCIWGNLIPKIYTFTVHDSLLMLVSRAKQLK